MCLEYRSTSGTGNVSKYNGSSIKFDAARFAAETLMWSLRHVLGCTCGARTQLRLESPTAKGVATDRGAKQPRNASFRLEHSLALKAYDISRRFRCVVRLDRDRKLFSLFRCPLFADLVQPLMLGLGEILKIIRVVVELVEVLVMDVVTFRLWSKVLVSHDLVQGLAISSPPAACLVVIPIHVPCSPTGFETLIAHARSPGRISDTGTNPRCSVQTR
jgi:hypothetical protein